MRGIHKVILPGVVLLLSLSTSMFAQGNATLSGAVTDSTGAVIPGAVVTVTTDTTGMAPTRVTNESGNYEFTNLLPGLYTLTAEVPGFETGIYRNVELKADQTGPPELYPRVGNDGHGRRGRDPCAATVGDRVDGADRRHQHPGTRQSGCDRFERAVADARSLVQRQRPTDQRRVDDRAADDAAQPGARSHSAPRQREAPPPIVDHRLARG